jgi:hypothetical protein
MHTTARTQQLSGHLPAVLTSHVSLQYSHYRQHSATVWSPAIGR